MGLCLLSFSKLYFRRTIVRFIFGEYSYPNRVILFSRRQVPALGNFIWG